MRLSSGLSPSSWAHRLTFLPVSRLVPFSLLFAPDTSRMGSYSMGDRFDLKIAVFGAGRLPIFDPVSLVDLHSRTLDTFEICILTLVSTQGMGGLGCALALAKKGFQDITVYENASNLGFVGAGIQLAPNMNRILDRLGCWQEIYAEATNVKETSIRRELYWACIAGMRHSSWRRWGRLLTRDMIPQRAAQIRN